MNQLVESLARLYKDGKVSQKTLDSLLSNKKITELEYAYIQATSK